MRVSTIVIGACAVGIGLLADVDSSVTALLFALGGAAGLLEGKHRG